MYVSAILEYSSGKAKLNTRLASYAVLCSIESAVKTKLRIVGHLHTTEELVICSSHFLQWWTLDSRGWSWF